MIPSFVQLHAQADGRDTRLTCQPANSQTQMCWILVFCSHTGIIPEEWHAKKH
jgi:hypothetical protein